MGVACSRGSQSPRDETKKPITKEVVSPNGVCNGTLPPKPNDNSNNKRTSESDTTSQNTEFTVEVVRVKARTPEPITKAYLDPVSKSLEVEHPHIAECLPLKRYERGDDTPSDKDRTDSGDAVVEIDEGRGTEDTELESVPTQEQNEDTEPKVNEKETNATAEHIPSDADVLSHSEQNASEPVTDESGTRGDLNNSTTEVDIADTQDQADSQILENNAKALVAEVISVATLEEQGHGNNVETGEATAPE